MENVQTVRHRLIGATADLHAQVDSRFSALTLSSRAGYRRFLEINAAVLVPLEAALEAAGIAGVLPDWPRRARREALAADLAEMGGRHEQLPVEVPLATWADLLGVAYVLEGSRLGAKYISHTIRASGHPASFLRHGEGLRLWPSFLSVLESELASEACIHSATQSAVQTFGLYDRAQDHFERLPVVAA